LRTRFTTLIAALLVFSVSAWAASVPPPVVPFNSEVPVKKVKVDPINFVRLRTFSVTFEKTTLSDVYGQIGTGAIEHQGDASESIYWLCYSAMQTPIPYRLWIVASGEMGGAQHSVTEISAQVLGADAATSDGCPELPIKFQHASLNGTIWLGAADQALQKQFGKPSWAVNEWRHYFFERSITVTSTVYSRGSSELPPGDWSVSSWLDAKIGKGKIISLFAGVITSN